MSCSGPISEKNSSWRFTIMMLFTWVTLVSAVGGSATSVRCVCTQCNSDTTSWRNSFGSCWPSSNASFVSIARIASKKEIDVCEEICGFEEESDEVIGFCEDSDESICICEESVKDISFCEESDEYIGLWVFDRFGGESNSFSNSSSRQSKKETAIFVQTPSICTNGT